jgi:hypothetical protein
LRRPSDSSRAADIGLKGVADTLELLAVTDV